MNILKVLTQRRIRGNFGEKAAARFLKKSGYRILEENYVGSRSEVDLVATTKAKDTLIFAEVKTRTRATSGTLESRPAASVTPEKQRKIISASREFLSRYVKKTRVSPRVRFDVLEVYVDNVDGMDRVAEIKHLISAFDLNTAYRKNNF